MRTESRAHPLVLVLLGVLAPLVAVRLGDPASIGSGPFDLLLGAGIAAFVVVCQVEKKRGLDDA